MSCGPWSPAWRSKPVDKEKLRPVLSDATIFGVDLYEVGLGARIEAMAAQLYAGTGAVRKTLHQYVESR